MVLITVVFLHFVSIFNQTEELIDFLRGRIHGNSWQNCYSPKIEYSRKIDLLCTSNTCIELIAINCKSTFFLDENFLLRYFWTWPAKENTYIFVWTKTCQRKRIFWHGLHDTLVIMRKLLFAIPIACRLCKCVVQITIANRQTDHLTIISRKYIHTSLWRSH